jgi:hypothetical protein
VCCRGRPKTASSPETSTTSSAPRDPCHQSAGTGAEGASAERWIGSARRECLDRLLIFSRLPPSDEQSGTDVIDIGRLRRRDVLGGLIHEYQHAA